jgi:2-methylisocitrate lyase-like PEP mutase family enzyme
MRQNSVFSAMHEEPAPASVPIYWVVNRIVNATERALLVSQLRTAGVKRILYVSPPLSAMHCLSSEQARVLFAQAQNSVRNAMLAGAYTRSR